MVTNTQSVGGGTAGARELRLVRLTSPDPEQLSVYEMLLRGAFPDGTVADVVADGVQGADASVFLNAPTDASVESIMNTLNAGVVPLAVAPFLAAAFGVQEVLFGASCIIALVGASTYLMRRASMRRAAHEEASC